MWCWKLGLKNCSTYTILRITARWFFIVKFRIFWWLLTCTLSPIVVKLTELYILVILCVFELFWIFDRTRRRCRYIFDMYSHIIWYFSAQSTWIDFAQYCLCQISKWITSSISLWSVTSPQELTCKRILIDSISVTCF